MMLLFWLAVLILCLVLELLTHGALICASFAPGAVASVLLAAFNFPIPVQIAAFVLLSAVSLFLLRPLIKKRGRSSVNIDNIIGSRAVVLERIENIAGCGLVKVGATSWSARAMSDDEIYEAGTVLTVVAVEGVKLICAKP